MTSGQAKGISHECPILAKIAPNNCRVEVTAICISDDPENPKIVVTQCTGDKRCGIEAKEPNRNIFFDDLCYVAKNPHAFLRHFKD